MKRLAAFSVKDLRTAARVIRIMQENGITLETLQENTKVFTTENKPAVVTTRKRGQTASGSRQRGKNKPTNFILAPGETELSGLACDECGGKVLNEGLCHSGMVKNKCVRLGTCLNCNKEFKIR